MFSLLPDGYPQKKKINEEPTGTKKDNLNNLYYRQLNQSTQGFEENSYQQLHQLEETTGFRKGKGFSNQQKD